MVAVSAQAMIKVPGSASVKPRTPTNSLMIGEKAAAVADIAGFGQLWVKTATPCQLWFTDDGGTDVQLGASNPAGNDTEIQFNNSGSFGASSNLTFGATNEGIHVTAADATTIAGIFTGASASSVDLVQYNPKGVTAGERARITSAASSLIMLDRQAVKYLERGQQLHRQMP